MHKVIISLASNFQHEQHLRQARQILNQMLLHPRYTPQLWTEAVGKNCDKDQRYLNQLVTASTDMSCTELETFLKETEIHLGRTEQLRQKGLVPIDLDLMLYDRQRHHECDWSRSYMKPLLAMLSKLKES